MRRIHHLALTLTLLIFMTPSRAAPPKSAAKGPVVWAEEGMVAYRAGQWEQARLALQQAFEQDPQTITAFNLSLAEVKTDHWVDAARHLAYYVRYEKDVKPKERQLLVEIEKRTGILEIEVNVDGATIQVDAERIGQWPLPVQPIYVLPGRHTIRADMEGFVSSVQSMEFPVGSRTRCELLLQPSATSKELSPTRQDPAPAPAAPSSVAAKVYPLPPETGLQLRTTALLTGGGLSLLAAGIGAAFAIDGVIASNNRDQLLNEIRVRYGAEGCPAYGTSLAACSSILSEEDRRNSSNRTANWAFAAGGVLAVATTAMFFLWHAQERTAGTTKVALVPARVGTGLAIHGEF